MLKAIETTYRGCKFRSRIEARWACFYDAMGIVWEYEAEGYELEDVGRYLPDFWLPELKFWIEIKGIFPTPAEIAKACALAGAGELPVVIFHGAIDVGALGGFAHPNGRFYAKTYAWGQCDFCKRVDVIDRDAWRKIHCPLCAMVRPYRVATPDLRHAYEVARAARFEHGEQPSILIQPRIKVR